MENFEFVSPRISSLGAGQKSRWVRSWRQLAPSGYSCTSAAGSAVASGLIERVGASLDAAGIEHLELGGVRPNPEITLVREGVRLCKRLTSMGARGGWRFGHRLREGHRQRCLRGRRRVGALRNQGPRPRRAAHRRGAHHPAPPVARRRRTRLFPTTSWAAKPATPTTPSVRKFAFMNPELTFTLSPFQTAAGLTDMFCHLLERFFDDVGAVPVTDNLNLSLMNTIRAEAPRVLADPTTTMPAPTSCGPACSAIRGSPEWAATRTGPPTVWSTRLSALNPAITHGAGLAVMFPCLDGVRAHREPARFAFYGQAVFGLTPTGDVEADALSAIDDALASSRAWGCPPLLPSWTWKRPTSRRCCRRWPRTRASPRHLQEADPGRRRGHLQAGAVGAGFGSPILEQQFSVVELLLQVVAEVREVEPHEAACAFANDAGVDKPLAVLRHDGRGNAPPLDEIGDAAVPSSSSIAAAKRRSPGRARRRWRPKIR